MVNEIVSVIIPTYKHVDELSRAIDSVLEQTYTRIEIIVVDDNPPDSASRLETIKVMERYKNNQKVVYIQNEKNSERSFTRNHGVKESHGKYVMFLDNDDSFFKEKVASQIQCLEAKGDEFAVCYSKYVRSIDNKVVWKSTENREGNLLKEILARDLPIHPGSNLMIRKDVFEQIGGFNESMSMNEDIDLLIRLMKITKIAYCDVCGLNVNLHSYSADFDFYEITEKYREIEKTAICSLSPNERKMVDQLHGLQLIKFYISKDIKKTLEIKKKYSVKTTSIISYFLYLIARMIKKEAYGYTLNKNI